MACVAVVVCVRKITKEAISLAQKEPIQTLQESKRSFLKQKFDARLKTRET